MNGIFYTGLGIRVLDVFEQIVTTDPIIKSLAITPKKQTPISHKQLITIAKNTKTNPITIIITKTFIKLSSQKVTITKRKLVKIIKKKTITSSHIYSIELILG